MDGPRRSGPTWFHLAERIRQDTSPAIERAHAERRLALLPQETPPTLDRPSPRGTKLNPSLRSAPTRELTDKSPYRRWAPKPQATYSLKCAQGPSHRATIRFFQRSGSGDPTSLRSHLYFFFRMPAPKTSPPPRDRHLRCTRRERKSKAPGFHPTSSLNQNFSQHIRHQFKGGTGRQGGQRRRREGGGREMRGSS